MTSRIGHWIDGRLTPGTSGRTSPVFNPAAGVVTAQVDLASSTEVDTAVASARTAAAEWRHASLSKRSGVLFAFRQQLHENADELARIVTAEHGKVHADALGEIARGLENVEFAAGVPQLMKGGFSEQAGTDVDVYSIRQPLGVVAGITPFNFPVMVPLWMCANAIACGNAFVLKPSEKDPSAGLLLARLWQRAGLPDGVFTVLHGDAEAVDA
ncbi:MAG: methylmalonate-semialdehyde dehydrogenase, partial [Nocardioidaceae bacterium]|nr:methylmalonate-semialdehyde dehydrogenase [Nocardioidaceae bacterium]